MTIHMKETNILVVCGGTGGHVYPAIAVAEELRRLYPAIGIVFAGRRSGFEGRAVSKVGFALRNISIKGWQRGKVFVNLPLIALVPLACLKACMILLSERPAVVFGTGGYVCLPVLFAASLLGKKIVLQEQNSFPGLTTRLFSGRARSVFLGYGEAKRFLAAPDRTVVTGNPVRRTTDAAQHALRSEYAIASGQKVVFVFGGSQGSLPINRIILKNIDVITNSGNVFILWQTGPDDYAFVQEQTQRNTQVRVFSYIDNMYDFYTAADLAVCRAGAMTISELMKFGIPAVFIPLPHAAEDHQSKNARAIEERGGGVCVDQEIAGEGIGVIIRALLGDAARLAAMKQTMKSLFNEDAAAAIARAIGKEGGL